MKRITVTVTLDGRVLIEQNRNLIEIVTPDEAQAVLAALQEACTLAVAIYGN